MDEYIRRYGHLAARFLRFALFLFNDRCTKVGRDCEFSFGALDPGDVKADVETLDETSWDIPEPTPQPTYVDGMNAEEVKERFDELFQKIKMHIEENGLQDSLNVTMEDDYIVMRMNESALFDSGSDVIKPIAKDILPEVCNIIIEYDKLINKIRIEGHTDTVPIQNGKFKDNWQLSNARTYSVLQYLLTMNLNPEKMWPIGLGEYHPVDVNTTEEGKARNRRVDFVLESILKD